MALKLITAPAALPVTLDEMKLHLRIDQTSEDTLINTLVEAATGILDGKDGWLGRALMPQTWELQLDAFPDVAVVAPTIVIPLPPLQSITSITYLDASNVTQTLDPVNYVVDSVTAPGRIAPTSGVWPAAMAVLNAVKVRFTAGYPGTVDDAAAGVPSSVKAAIKLMAANWYENRESVIIGMRPPEELPMGVQALLSSLKVWRF